MERVYRTAMKIILFKSPFPQNNSFERSWTQATVFAGSRLPYINHIGAEILKNQWSLYTQFLLWHLKASLPNQKQQTEYNFFPKSSHQQAAEIQCMMNTLADGGLGVVFCCWWWCFFESAIHQNSYKSFPLQIPLSCSVSSRYTIQ